MYLRLKRAKRKVAKSEVETANRKIEEVTNRKKEGGIGSAVNNGA